MQRPEVRKLGLCRLATSAATLPLAVRGALDEDGGPRAERALRVAGESWEARVDDNIRRHVAEALARKRAAS
jgi:hypothetical protein